MEILFILAGGVLGWRSWVAWGSDDEADRDACIFIGVVLAIGLAAEVRF